MSTDFTDSPNELASTSTNETFPRPVAHGFGVSTVFNDDNALYGHFRDLWFDRISRPEDEPDHGLVLETWGPDFLPATYDLRFRSSRWKAGMERDGDWTRWHKYHLTLRRRSDGSKTPPISLKVSALTDAV